MPSPTHLLNLVAAESAAPLDGRTLALVAAHNFPVAEPRWLSPARACDLPLDGAPPADAVAGLREALSAAQVDVNAVAVANRRKRLLVADMDSTMVEQETLDELAAAVGVKDAVAAITARSMAGELDFSAALRERIAMMAGTPRAAIDALAAALTFVPGGATLVATMRANGAHTALVTGGFVEIAGRSARALGFDDFQANRFLFADDRIVGVAEPILDRDAKLSALQRQAAARGLAPADALAVGDGANDVAMLRAAGLGVAFRGKAIVRSQVAVQVNHSDLTALLYLQGYSDAEFTRPT
ncbi:MAG: phosphoserine phosphatase SerB [Alphaproteobacteria bacterium]